MSWRSVIIRNPAKLCVQENHLHVKSQDRDDFPLVPLGDIGAIVVETLQATLTAGLLEALSQQGVPLFICDTKHLPTGVFLPFQQHSRVLKVQRTQLSMTGPFNKNCWKSVVQSKIRNQATCLELMGLDGKDALLDLALDVKSGDSTNRESVASRIYFAKLMPGVFRRDEHDINSALNYGYALIRGAIARCFVAYGFLITHGIHHQNELNSYNLADDFMEVFRPLIDLWVFSNIKNWEGFGAGMRQRLVALLHAEMLVKGEKHAVLHAMNILAASFSAACNAKDPRLLCMPELLPIDSDG